MANRMKKILSQIISKEHTSFVRGKSILDGFVIAQEAIHSLQCNKMPGMLIKLDIRKAYNKVHWRLSCKVLEDFGFNKK